MRGASEMTNFVDLYREESIIIGILYILVFIVGIFSVSKVIDDSDFLAKSATNSRQIKRAAGFQFLMAIFHIAIMVVLYATLKSHSKELAIGFLSFRILAIIFTLLGTIVLFSLLRVSQKFIMIPNSDTSGYLSLGNRLKHYRDLINHVGMIITICLSSVALYLILLQSELVPSWISIWGIAGAIIAIFASTLVATNRLKVKTTTYMILNIPIALLEIVFSIWLIFNGLML
ncbi:MAG: DUF4386 domain-containing protein [Cyclobacteriaceae bacterium]